MRARLVPLAVGVLVLAGLAQPGRSDPRPSPVVTPRCGGPVAPSRCPTPAVTGRDLPAYGTVAVATPRGDQVLTLGGDGFYADRMAVSVVDTATGRERYRRSVWLGARGWFSRAAASPDGRVVVAAGTLDDTGDDGTRPVVVAWDVAAGRLRWTHVGAERNRYDFAQGVDVDPAGRFAYVATGLGEKAGSYVDDLLVEQLDLASGHVGWRARVGDEEGLDQYPLGLHLAAGRVVVPAGAQVRGDASLDYDEAVYFFDPTDGSLLRTLRHDGGSHLDDYVMTSAVSPDRRQVVLAGWGPDAVSGNQNGAQTVLVDAARMRFVWAVRTQTSGTDTSAWAVAFAGSRVVVGAETGVAEAYPPAPGTYGYLGAGYVATAVGLDRRTGKEDWRNDVLDPTGVTTLVAAVAASPDGRTAYWVGYSGPSDSYLYARASRVAAWVAGGADALVLAMDTATGQLRWSSRWNAQDQGFGSVYLPTVVATRSAVVTVGSAWVTTPEQGDLDGSGTGVRLRFLP
jgi:hypothetical protein